MVVASLRYATLLSQTLGLLGLLATQAFALIRTGARSAEAFFSPPTPRPMPSILETTQDLARLADTGHVQEAVSTYYADDVTITEATGETAQGREAQLGRMKEFESSIREMHGGGVHAVTANEDEGVSMVESWIDATFADGNRTKLEEVERYVWEDGKIVDARFYYATGGAPSS